MPRIKFTTDPKLPRDLAHLGYRQGTEVDLSDDQVDRWLRRGVAVVLPPAPAAAAEPAAPAVDIPADWRELHHMARMSIARRLTADPVENTTAADVVIAAEVERRAAAAP